MDRAKEIRTSLPTSRFATENLPYGVSIKEDFAWKGVNVSPRPTYPQSRGRSYALPFANATNLFGRAAAAVPSLHLVNFVSSFSLNTATRKIPILKMDS